MSIPIKKPKQTNSIYIRNTPPTEDFLQEKIHNIYPKLSQEWVDHNIITKCQLCDNKFGWLTRKHHCRSCGGVFCGYCCNKYVHIPKKLIDVPKENNIWSIYIKNAINEAAGYKTDKSLVCNTCEIKIRNLHDIENLIKICEFLSLPDLYNTIILNKNWHNASVHCLRKFRNIQYKPPDQILTKYECDTLWINQRYLSGHCSWFMILLKSYLLNSLSYNSTNKVNAQKFIHKFHKKKHVSCSNVLCSRKCNLELELIDVLDVLQYIAKIPQLNTRLWSNPEHLELLYQMIKKTTDHELINMYYIVPFLTNTIRLLISNTTKYSSDYIIKLLDLVCDSEKKLTILTFEYNYLKGIETHDNSTFNLCEILRKYLKSKFSDNNSDIINRTINTLCSIYFENNRDVSISLPILYPCDLDYKIVEINDVKELASSSKPLLLNMYIQKDGSEERIKKKMIIKKDECLRKENIVSSLIILLQHKLVQQMKRGRIDHFEEIPTYKVIMLTNNLGVVEFLEDFLTLRNISNKNYTLQNFILDNNKDTKIGIIKERFTKSLAISSCFSYILGLGDRHASNIMISKDGSIIHIDYGYILENPIHTSLLFNPIIRVTGEMMDFIGGSSSEYYKMFKEYIIKLFDIIRLYTDIVINYYHILGYENIINWDVFKKRLSDRFMNGMSIKDIEVVLLDAIENSSSSYSGAFIDFCNTLTTKISSK